MMHPEIMRLALLRYGLRYSERVGKQFNRRIKEPTRTRAGAAGGLDIILADDETWVNVPVHEAFVRRSPYILQYVEDTPCIFYNEKIVQRVCFPKRPVFYKRHTSDGTPMKKVGVMLGDRLAISLTNLCIFWNTKDVCKYCSIGLNTKEDLLVKHINHCVETARAAVKEGCARHIALNSGGMHGEDRGALLYGRYVQALRRETDVPIAVQMLPPETVSCIDYLKDCGTTELTFDMEIYDWQINHKLSPGKAKIGFKTYYTALEKAVRTFGAGNVTSNLIVGLEPVESTIRGVQFLAEMGVVPKLIIFRPLMGTPLEGMTPPSVLDMAHTLVGAQRATSVVGGRLGPTCPMCNINRLVPKEGVDILEEYRKHSIMLPDEEPPFFPYIANG